jgi:hypothetical protein
MTPPLCQEGCHIVVKMPGGTGVYTCSNCGLSFHEHHEIQLMVGAGASPQGASPPQPQGLAHR